MDLQLCLYQCFSFLANFCHLATQKVQCYYYSYTGCFWKQKCQSHQNSPNSPNFYFPLWPVCTSQNLADCPCGWSPIWLHQKIETTQILVSSVNHIQRNNILSYFPITSHEHKILDIAKWGAIKWLPHGPIIVTQPLPIKANQISLLTLSRENLVSLCIFTRTQTQFRANF